MQAEFPWDAVRAIDFIFSELVGYAQFLSYTSPSGVDDIICKQDASRTYRIASIKNLVPAGLQTLRYGLVCVQMVMRIY